MKILKKIIMLLPCLVVMAQSEVLAVYGNFFGGNQVADDAFVSWQQEREQQNALFNSIVTSVAHNAINAGLYSTEDLYKTLCWAHDVSQPDFKINSSADNVILNHSLSVLKIEGINMQYLSCNFSVVCKKYSQLSVEVHPNHGAFFCSLDESLPSKEKVKKLQIAKLNIAFELIQRILFPEVMRKKLRDESFTSPDTEVLVAKWRRTEAC